MMSRGSTALPLDLDIRVPSRAMIVEVMITSSNGLAPVKRRPVMIIRATQRLMISRAVTRTWVG